MQESPLFWPVKLEGKTMLVLDETALPEKSKYIKVKNTHEAVQVIREMRTRAFGQFLVVLNTFLLVLKNRRDPAEGPLLREIEKTAEQLNASRPTFPFREVTGMVLGFVEEALGKRRALRPYLEKNISSLLVDIRAKRLKRVKHIASIIKNGDRILTHCNVSGELAMASQICREKGKSVHFYATETRPYFQGAKLTSWELKKAGADVTLIADNAIGPLFRNHVINRVIVGSDRSCANGDIANKIGTYQIAVMAKEFHVPFHVLTQPSKKVKKGENIPIEIRDAKELLTFEGKRIVPPGVDGFYPGFDVVPHKFITESIAVHAN